MTAIALSDSRPTLERLRKYLTAHDGIQATLERSSSFYNWELSSLFRCGISAPDSRPNPLCHTQ